MAGTVTVGCKLPQGLEIQVGDKTAVLNGLNQSAIIGGHGITEGVDKELFDAWMIQRKDSAVVKNGFVFAHEKLASAQAEARNRQSNKTGLEGLDPNKPAPGIKPAEKD